MTEPVYDQPDMVVADLDAAAMEAARLTRDVDGHYSRPAVFTLTVNRQSQRNVESE
ncbi:MAG: hypothetical protein PVG91_00155 [Gammaproteobacteria bacterium]